MRFQALSVGVQVPTHSFSGTVHSVFHRACNIELDSDRLLTLLPYQHGNLPCGIRLNSSAQLHFLDTFHIGQSVACRGGMLRIEGIDVSVDLRTAHSWDMNLRKLHIDVRRPRQAQAWSVALSEWNRQLCRTGTLGIIELGGPTRQPFIPSVVSESLVRQTAQFVPALLHATKTLRLHDAMNPIGSLIGLGPGLTPSGDDFLVGYLAGLWSTVGHDTSRLQFLTSLGTALCEAARNTTPISRTYLRSAVMSHVSQPIAELAKALQQSNDMEEVRKATRAALHIGHTSGSDGVMGLLLGCIAWRPVPSI